MRFSLILFLFLSLTGCATAPHAVPMVEARPVGGIYHEVKSGETLWRISKLYDIDLRILTKANSIQDTDIIAKGQRLLIPGAYKRKRDFEYPIAKDSFSWPVSGTIISSFGTKVGRVRNKGIDICARIGSNVRASRSGKVVFCDEQLKGYGRTIILDHGDDHQTVYAYNSEILVKVGDVVEGNYVIAKVGETGRAKEPSLHFEIRKDGEPQNPFHYLPH